MMIHHQLLPLNQLQIPQLLLPHIIHTSEIFLSFTAHSMVFRRTKNVPLRKRSRIMDCHNRLAEFAA